MRPANTCMETSSKDVICLNDTIITSNVVARLTHLTSVLITAAQLEYIFLWSPFIAIPFYFEFKSAMLLLPAIFVVVILTRDVYK